MKAHEICNVAAKLVSGDRAREHGEAQRNHANIAAMWNAYCHAKFGALIHVNLTGEDVMHMMALLKVARTMTGAYNPDDWTDAIGYLALAGASASADAAMAAAIVRVEAA